MIYSAKVRLNVTTAIIKKSNKLNLSALNTPVPKQLEDQ